MCAFLDVRSRVTGQMALCSPFTPAAALHWDLIEHDSECVCGIEGVLPDSESYCCWLPSVAGGLAHTNLRIVYVMPVHS